MERISRRFWIAPSVETLFAPESQDAPILIAGPAESAGLTADAIWFLGATEQCLASQRRHTSVAFRFRCSVRPECRMPRRASIGNLAGTVTRRLLASAPEVHFSFARQNEGVEARPSRLVEQLAGAPHPLPPELAAAGRFASAHCSLSGFDPRSLPSGDAHGGASTLTAQSQCAFKAFAIARLDAEMLGSRRSRTHRQRARPASPRSSACRLGRPAARHSFPRGTRRAPRSSLFVADHVRLVLDPPCPFARASPCRLATSLSKRLGSSTSSPNGWTSSERVFLSPSSTRNKKPASPSPACPSACASIASIASSTILSSSSITNPAAPRQTPGISLDPTTCSCRFTRTSRSTGDAKRNRRPRLRQSSRRRNGFRRKSPRCQIHSARQNQRKFQSGQKASHFGAAFRVETLHRESRPGLSRRPLRRQPARLPRHVRTLPSAGALPHQRKSAAAGSNSEEAADA